MRTKKQLENFKREMEKRRAAAEQAKKQTKKSETDKKKNRKKEQKMKEEKKRKKDKNQKQKKSSVKVEPDSSTCSDSDSSADEPLLLSSQSECSDIGGAGSGEEPEQLFEVAAVHSTHRWNKYRYWLVEWKGIDPETGKAYEYSWEPQMRLGEQAKIFFEAYKSSHPDWATEFDSKFNTYLEQEAVAAKAKKKKSK